MKLPGARPALQMQRAKAWGKGDGWAGVKAWNKRKSQGSDRIEGEQILYLDV